jgi:hypothetical protein
VEGRGRKTGDVSRCSLGDEAPGDVGDPGDLACAILRGPVGGNRAGMNDVIHVTSGTPLMRKSG